MKQKIITLLGAVFIVYGLILSSFSNLNFGVLFVLFLGIVVLCAGIFHTKIKVLSRRKFFRIFMKVFVVCLCIELIFVAFIAVYGVRDNATYTEDAVIVLGAGISGENVSLLLKMRLDKAMEYHSKNPECLIVVTGGQGFQETVTEAYAMEKYLVQNGIDKNKIIKEEKATSTFENMKFSKQLLDKRFENDYSVVVVTNNFHIFRGTTLAENSGFKNVTHLHAGLQWYNYVPCLIRESFAVVKMFIFEKEL